ncbi:vitamin K epoxide reductase family protein [Actinokineospora soli]|uniref:Vitamin K epoxide reductase family protein n=1 Tax=Actinokineospora soli TaxID=1048753 RepID=A0ABW2TNR1_9PSEU
MNRALAWLYVVGGGLGLVAAAALILEKLAVLRDPAHVPLCSINPVVSCGSVMESPQAEAFGFPNPLLGIAAFAVVVTVGVVGLTGFAPPRWFRIGMLVGVTFGVLFVHWLIFASLYDIRALCPYCMVVWVVVIPLFWYTVLDTCELPTLRRVHSVVLALWYVVIVALILQAFWSFWTG